MQINCYTCKKEFEFKESAFCCKKCKDEYRPNQKRLETRKKKGIDYIKTRCEQLAKTSDSGKVVKNFGTLGI